MVWMGGWVWDERLDMDERVAADIATRVAI
jgi:hypothetical protein